jgi:hypothetical protein
VRGPRRAAGCLVVGLKSSPLDEWAAAPSHLLRRARDPTRDQPLPKRDPSISHGRRTEFHRVEPRATRHSLTHQPSCRVATTWKLSCELNIFRIRRPNVWLTPFLDAVSVQYTHRAATTKSSTATFTPSFPLLTRFGVVVRELAPKPPEWTSSTRPHWLTAMAAQPQSAPPPTDSTNYLCPTNSARAAVEIASAPFSDGLTCMCRPQTESQVRCDDCHSITGTRPSRCWSAAVMLVLVVITGIPAVLGYAAYLTQG